MQTISIVLVGVGGYGAKICKNALDNAQAYGIEIVGVVEYNLNASPMKEAILAQNIPVYTALEDFYAEHKADLAIICTPIPFHEEHCILAMKNGSHVLCEKPTAATLAQSDRMAAAAKKYKKHLNIGFQLCYMDSILALKQDVLKGELGKPLCMSALICWPRTSEYYARSWCAKRKWNGRLVLDSIAMNACAHYLNLMFFLGGKTMDSTAEPVSSEAILTKANDIETYDTAIIRTFTKDYELRLLSTHVCGRRINPIMKFSFEKADVYFKEAASEDAVKVVFHDGREKLYGRTNNYSKLPYCFDIVRGLKTPTCTPATARAHLKLVNAVTEKVPVLTVTDKRVIDDVVVVPGMDDLLEQAYQENKLPWEMTDRFGAPTKIDLTTYEGWYEEL